MRLRWSFRSPYVPCFSVAPEPVNVPGRLAATSLATQAPGKKIAAGAVPSAHTSRLIGDGRMKRPCKAALAAHPCASPRPCGLRFADFQPDPVLAATVLFSLRSVIAAKRNITGAPSALREWTRQYPAHSARSAVHPLWAVAACGAARRASAASHPAAIQATRFPALRLPAVCG